MGLLPGSPRAEEESRRRRLEQSIASTIRGYKGVNTAKVHLTLPRESVFVDEQIPATASVILEMKKGHYLRESLANAIISAVARAVPKLKVEDIVLTDTEGRVYEQGLLARSPQNNSSILNERWKTCSLQSSLKS